MVSPNARPGFDLLCRAWQHRFAKGQVFNMRRATGPASPVPAESCDFMDPSTGDVCGEPLVIGLPFPDSAGEHRRCDRHYSIQSPQTGPRHEQRTGLSNDLEVVLRDDNAVQRVFLHEERGSVELRDAEGGTIVRLLLDESELRYISLLLEVPTDEE